METKDFRIEMEKIFDIVWYTPGSLPRKIMEARPSETDESESECEEDILRFKANLPTFVESFEQAVTLTEAPKRS